MVCDIIHDPDFLCQKSTEATEADLTIAEDLLDTLKANWDHCPFLAANMIGKRKRMIAFCNGPLFVVMLNPEIIGHTGEYESEEECPSDQRPINTGVITNVTKNQENYVIQ